MKKAIASLIIIFLFWMGCGENNKGTSDLGIDSVEYHYKELDQTFGDCESEDSPCATLKLSYPVFDGNYNPFSNGKVNYIDSLLLGEFFGEQNYPSIDSLKNDFFNEYKTVLEDFKDFIQRWSLERNIEVIYNNGRLMSLKFYEFSFTGGAHPNYFTILYTFDVSNTRIIAQNEVIKNGAWDKVNSLAEKKFRQVRGLSEDENLSEAGFWFDDGEFKISENFALTEDGLLFFYNSYDIAPYALGTTEFLLTYEELEGLINEVPLF